MNTVSELFNYFDSLVEQDNSDILFASSYVRAFIALAAAELDEQKLTLALANKSLALYQQEKAELSSQDQQVVSDFWQTIRGHFCY
jgi:hypothetical protein